jgi:addiction module HigA family antidote
MLFGDRRLAAPARLGSQRCLVAARQKAYSTRPRKHVRFQRWIQLGTQDLPSAAIGSYLREAFRVGQHDLTFLGSPRGISESLQNILSFEIRILDETGWYGVFKAGEENMFMKNPPHPGNFIRTEIVEAAGLTVTAAAIALRVSRPTLSSLLNGKADLSGDMALRIEKAFGVKMDTLMRMQSSYDIAKTRKREKQISVPRFSLLAATD